MKTRLIGGNELRFESESDEEGKFLIELHNALYEPREAHYQTFLRVFPFRRGILGKIFQPNRGSLWEKWLTISPRVSSARFHDGSLILSIKEHANKSAQAER